MLLSIVMMIKNESKILNKTLDSLKQLSQYLNTELIIMDTGSDDNSVEIARQYTDKVYIEEWNGNFAEMRNKSISYANGDWILILDADEVLVEYDKLISFFKDKIFENYNSASIRLKNIYSEDEVIYGYCSLMRIFRNNDIEYCGRIHEQPNYKEPIYNDIAEFKHYGYLFEDNDEKSKKIKRNEVLLLQELQVNPNDPYMIYQLCQNYLCEGKLKEAENEGKKSLKIYKKYGVKATYVYEILMKIYIMQKKYIECESLCKEYIKRDKNNIDIYYYLAISQMNQNKIRESTISFERYLYLINNYALTTQANDIMSSCDTIRLKNDVLLQLMKLYLDIEEYKKVLDIFELIDDSNKGNSAYKYLIKSLVNLSKENLILEYEKNTYNSYTIKNKLYSEIESFLLNSSKETKYKFYKILSNIDGKYGKLNKIRITENIDLKNAIDLLNDDENEVFYGCILSIVIKNNIDIYELFKDMDSIWIYKYVGYAMSIDKKVLNYVYNYLIESSITFDKEKIRIYKILSELVLSISNQSEKYEMIIYLYSMYSYQYMKSLYNNLEDEILMKHLSYGDRFVIKFRGLLESNNKNSIDYVNELKLLLRQYPKYNKSISLLIEDAELNIKKGQEFEDLKNIFISNITLMIENNNLNEANKLIEEYLINFKEDSYILNIKGVIQILKNDFRNANITLKKALSLDINNEDTIYNINYLNEILLSRENYN